MPTYYAQVSYTGDGSTTQYSITFPFIDLTHIKVFISGAQTTNFTISSSTLTFNTAPGNNVPIRIERDTPIDARIVDFTDGSVLTEGDLDKSADQNFYMAQEIRDDNTASLKIDADDKFDAQNKVIKNLANPVNDTDAVNKQFISTNIPNITTVAGISSNVTTVAGVSSNVTTVANNIASVNTVATDIAKVIAVANDLAEAVSEVETVANDLNETTSEIDTVANAITNVDLVGNNIANVNTVAGISANVSTVAGISANVTTVASNNSNVSTVAGISSDVTAVAGISSDIQAVENIKANITTVAGISSNVTSVAGIASAVSAVNSNATNINAVNSNSTNINTVAGNNTNISTVAGISSDVTTVAGIASDVSTVRAMNTAVINVSNIAPAVSNVNSNSSNINAVSANATNINTVAGSSANINTIITNLAGINSFAERYRVGSSDPTSSLDEGDLAYNSTSNLLKFYNGSAWVNVFASNTDSLAEGSTNLYYTNARADARADAKIASASINDLSDVDTSGISTGKILKYDGTNFTASDDGGGETLFNEQDKTVSTSRTITTDNTKYQWLFGTLAIASGVTLTISGNGTLDVVDYNSFRAI